MKVIASRPCATPQEFTIIRMATFMMVSGLMIEGSAEDDFSLKRAQNFRACFLMIGQRERLSLKTSMEMYFRPRMKSQQNKVRRPRDKRVYRNL